MCDKQSGRFGVISNSKTVSLIPKYSFIGTPTGVSSGKIMIPEESFPIFNSSSEHNIPFDSTPLILPFLITKSGANFAPTCASTTLSPAL